MKEYTDQPSAKIVGGYREASKYSHSSRTTLWRLHKAGKLPIVKIGRRRLFTFADLDALFANSREG